MDVPFAQAGLYLSKITSSHFSALNTKIANQNVVKRVLIAMLNENTAVSSGRPHLASWGGVTSKISLVLVHFGLIKLKPKQNTSAFPTYFTC